MWLEGSEVSLGKHAGAKCAGPLAVRFGFYSKCSEKSLREFKQDSNVISN